MSTKPKPKATDKDPEEDLNTFKQLPQKTKEQMHLKDEDEKSIGTVQVETTLKIPKGSNY